MEILKEEQYGEFDSFVENHPRGEFMQSTAWRKVKNNWNFEAVVSRDSQGKIVGACGALIQKVPIFGTSFIYCPRGPICDISDKAVLLDLKSGMDVLAKKYNAHELKWDPYERVTNTEFIKTMEEMGFKRFYGPEGFETIQARFNYILYLEGKSEEDVLMKCLTQKTRYNLRYAQKHGVEMRVGTKDDLDEFMRIYSITGERDGFNTRPKEYFVRMLDALGEHVRLYIGTYEGRVVCGAITTNYAGKCSYVYGASDNAYRNLMPNYLMQWEMIKWALETNCYAYDFQGIAGDIENEANPMFGLYRFKRGFGGEIAELAGEFNYLYKPFTKKMIDVAMKIRKKLR